jgi:FHA domain
MAVQPLADDNKIIVAWCFGRGSPTMPARLVALDDGPDINLDRAMVVVGRHPSCDTRLDSLRVSRHHCCMTQENGEVMVRDLGSTNGIRINGQRVEIGRIRAGDELSIAHIRYRLENGQGHEQTIAEVGGAGILGRPADEERVGSVSARPLDVAPLGNTGENAFAAAVRKLLPNGVADKCRIQVIVQMAGDPGSDEAQPVPMGQNLAAENAAECHSDSVH